MQRKWVLNAPAGKYMQQRQARQLVLNFLEAFYAGDVARTQDCCDDDFDSITYAPVELFPHLGHKHGKAWVAEAIRIQQERYLSRRYEITFFAVDRLKVATTQRVYLQKRNDQRLVQFDVADFFTLRNGRIIEHRSFFDSFDLIQQLLGRDLTDGFAAVVQGATRT
jgi:ketosteroid isomerase-like protein